MNCRTRWAIIFLAGFMVAGCAKDSVGPTTPKLTVAADQVPPYRGSYRLPVVGSWYVHRTHYGHKGDQAYAVDLVKRGRKRNRNRSNDAYPSYEQVIVADGPGVVVTAVDGVHDNQPGVVNGYDAHGNFVVIDHRNGEYSLFAHLIPGTVRVKVGQVVAMGDVLGRCGNSGRSTMPHLHWQIMNGPYANRAKGVEVRHLPYLRNGDLSREALQQGDIVEAVDR